VGNALNKNLYPAGSRGKVHPVTPCHRVVKSTGEVGGYALGSAKKINILTREGVKIKNGRVDLGRFEYHLKAKS
jgi:methylated-DNA-[protein]-cysteine S-methyltransferase